MKKPIKEKLEKYLKSKGIEDFEVKNIHLFETKVLGYYVPKNDLISIFTVIKDDEAYFDYIFYSDYIKL